MKTNFKNINQQLQPLMKTKTDNYTTEMQDYLNFYGLDLADKDIQHTFGIFSSQGRRLAAHIYKPIEYKATYFLLHGYFDHCGLLSKLIAHLLSQGFAVATFDLFGHGISQGRECEIDDFSQYSNAINNFVAEAGMLVKKPYHFIGHSTGASGVINLLLDGGGNQFEKIMLAAPLIRCSSWQKSKLGYTRNIPFVISVPRVFRKNSSDADFVSFVKNEDPLQCKFVPLNWVSALHRWNEKIANAATCSKQIEMIQGSSDRIVDWQYNATFLAKKFPHLKLHLVEDANHELFNESDRFRNQVFDLLT